MLKSKNRRTGNACDYNTQTKKKRKDCNVRWWRSSEREGDIFNKEVDRAHSSPGPTKIRGDISKKASRNGEKKTSEDSYIRMNIVGRLAVKTRAEVCRCFRTKSTLPKQIIPSDFNSAHLQGKRREAQEKAN